MQEATECVRCGATDDEPGVVVGDVSPINGVVCNDCRVEELLDGTVLKRRQAEVYNLLENGYSQHEVAETLKISESTVSTHRSDILRAIRNANRTVDWLDDQVLRL